MPFSALSIILSLTLFFSLSLRAEISPCLEVLKEIGNAKVAEAMINKLEKMMSECESASERCKAQNYHTLRSIVNDYLLLKPATENIHSDEKALNDLIKSISPDGRTLTHDESEGIRDFKDSISHSKNEVRNKVRQIKSRLVKFLDPESHKPVVLTISPSTSGHGGTSSGAAIYLYFEYIRALSNKMGWTITNLNEVEHNAKFGKLNMGTTHLTIVGPKNNEDVRRFLQHENGEHNFQRVESNGSNLAGQVVTNKIQVRVAPELKN